MPWNQALLPGPGGAWNQAFPEGEGLAWNQPNAGLLSSPDTYAWEPDGVADYVVCDPIGLVSQLTYVAWIKLDPAPPGLQHIIHAEGTLGGVEFVLQQRNAPATDMLANISGKFEIFSVGGTAGSDWVAIFLEFKSGQYWRGWYMNQTTGHVTWQAAFNSAPAIPGSFSADTILTRFRREAGFADRHWGGRIHSDALYRVADLNKDLWHDGGNKVPFTLEQQGIAPYEAFTYGANGDDPTVDPGGLVDTGPNARHGDPKNMIAAVQIEDAPA